MVKESKGLPGWVENLHDYLAASGWAIYGELFGKKTGETALGLKFEAPFLRLAIGRADQDGVGHTEVFYEQSDAGVKAFIADVERVEELAGRVKQ